MTLVKRKGWDLNFNTIVQLGYRINHNSNQFIMLQYYNGYGETLLDYNQYHSRIRWTAHQSSVLQRLLIP